MKRNGFVWVEIIIVIFIMALIAGAFTLPAYSCEKQAKTMGMRYDWQLLQGCMIEPRPGQWVPLRNYRVL